tara:strand:- start:2217 stop:2540 length:324 start_codon:yes stop_codon:yes gene_type:complete
MIRKNKKRIDPRYFLNETILRENEEMWDAILKDLWVASEEVRPPGYSTVQRFIELAPDYGVPEEDAQDIVAHIEDLRTSRDDNDRAGMEVAASMLAQGIRNLQQEQY